jgi:hypothetical protein
MKKIVLLAVITAAFLTPTVFGKAQSETIASPKGEIHVTGPIKGGTHGWPFGAYFGDIGKLGYVEEEYFIEGNAALYSLVGEWTKDGKWTLKRGDASPYKIRILVWRPADWQPVMAAAFRHINNWISGGAPPPIMPPIEVTETNGKLEYSRDQYGNTLGGIRLPELEVPYAQIVINTRTRMVPGASTFLLPAAYLKRLYPTHDDYVAKVTEAVNKAQAQGIILQHAADDYIKRAKAAPIPGPNYSDAIRSLLIQ